jgi:hypothetical protein
MLVHSAIALPRTRSGLNLGSFSGSVSVALGCFRRQQSLGFRRAMPADRIKHMLAVHSGSALPIGI